MDTIEVIWLALMLVMLLLSAFFSGSEAAFLSIQRGKLAVMIKNKVRGAESVGRITTSAIVAGIFLIIVADAIFTVLFHFWG